MVDLLFYCLQIFCVLLFGNTGLKAKDAVVRGTSIDLLGMVAAHLKQDAVACSREKFWILQELEGKRDDDEDDENVKKNCTVCGKGNRSKVMVSCNSCNRWFHGDCIGVTKHDLFDRGWLCHCCLCRQQLASLRPDIKVQATGVKPSHGTKLTQNAENSADRLAIIHQTLLNYLQEMAVNDSTAIYARR
jgi:cohesin loading factor subunit SCC2